MSYLDLKDTLAGAEAKAYATIDGKVYEMFYARKLTATVKKQKIAGKTLGNRALQVKAAGFSGSGKLTVYYVSSMFREQMSRYMRTGVDCYFDLQVVNHDPTSSAGRQTVVLRNVNLDALSMAAFDVDAEALAEEMSFTFDGVELIESFTTPALR